MKLIFNGVTSIQSINETAKSTFIVIRFRIGRRVFHSLVFLFIENSRNRKINLRNEY